MMRALGLAAVLAWACSGASTAQDIPVSSPILTLDQERLLEGSGLTARISSEITRLSQELAEENRRIETDLVAEELELTEQRPQLEPEKFRELADAFDARVQALREEQDAKALELQRLQDDERQNFLRQITPVIAAIVRERGALLVIDRRVAILSADAIDITDEAIERVNAVLSAQDGEEQTPAPNPFAVPDPIPLPDPFPAPDPSSP